MAKIDFKKELGALYRPSAKEIVRVDAPKMNFLMVNGNGDPNISEVYSAAVEALFALSYSIKFAVRSGAPAIDYGVMPLEGLWWADDMATFSVNDKANWKWTMMIMQPEFVSSAMVEDAIAEVKRKKELTAIADVRFESFTEGVCAQVMHIGPFSQEGQTIERLHRFVADSGQKLAGKHHEIYLSDVRRADPAKWRTILRQPMR